MPTRLLIAFLAGAAALPAAEPEGELAPLVARLRDENPAARAAAREALLARGSPALRELRAALAKAATEAHRASIRDVIAAIEKREPHGIRFAADLPRVLLDDVNRDTFRFPIRLRNGGDDPVVLWPFFTLRILDSEGREVKPDMYIGRWGLGRSQRYLEDIGFIEIPPGETRTIDESLARYMRDPACIVGWEIPRAGEYTLEFTYEFDRAAAKKGCDRAWKALDDPARPWNRAVELKHVFTAKLKVAEPDATAKRR